MERHSGRKTCGSYICGCGEAEEEKQRRKDKKKLKTAKRRLICVDYNARHTVSNSLIVDDDLVVFQILSRLPVKSLVRFKCVCKCWKSIIERASHFINLHHAHSEARPGFFIVVQDYTSGYESYLSGDFLRDGRGANIHTVRKIVSSSSYLKPLGPVRGLICLVDIFAVQIYNVSTGEVTPWIKSIVFINLEKQNVIVKVGERPECYFGFDPITGKHKAIFVWYKGKFKDLPVCEVLAVGDNAWRRIDDAPPCKPNGNISAYANGSIYWFMYNGIPPWRCCGKVEYSESIMAFDIGSEKFRVIIIPKFTILEYTLPSCYGFLEMDGCLTLIRRRDHTVKMWKFHDYDKEIGTSADGSAKYWTEVTIILPFYISFHMSIYFHSVAGKDQMILETYSPPPSMDEDVYGGFERNIKFAWFYSYSRIKKIFRKFKIEGISFIPEDCSTECATFVENLLSVEKKLQH